jgi:transposase-like protein
VSVTTVLGRSDARPVPALPSSAFAWFRFPPEIIVLALRWYLRFGSPTAPSTLLAERGIEVDHVSVYREREESAKPEVARPALQPLRVRSRQRIA